MSDDLVVIPCSSIGRLRSLVKKFFFFFFFFFFLKKKKKKKN